MGETIPGANPAAAARSATRGSESPGRPTICVRPRFVSCEAARGERQARERNGSDHERDRPRRREAGEPARPLARRVEASRGPEERTAEDRHRRRHERDRDAQADQHGERHPRTERAEEVELACDERGRSAGDDEPRRDDDGQVVGRRALRCLDPLLARGEPLAHPVQEEDGVVGDHAEQEHDEHGLRVARDRDVEALADHAGRSQRDDVRDARGEERHERRDRRAEVDAEDQRDQRDRRDRHPRQAALDLPPLLHARRDDAGHPDEAVVREAHVLLREPVRELVLVVEVGLRRVEVEVGDRRRAGLARAGEDVAHVHDRNRAADLAQLGILSVCDALRAAGDPLERGA